MDGYTTDIDGLMIVKPDVHGDSRGWFMESYSKPKFKELGIDCDFVQDNHSYSAKKGVLRGLHFQLAPMGQCKLIRCTRGAIRDVAADLRPGSPTYREWVSVELSAENKAMFFIPVGFAHGFVTLTDDVEIQYKVDTIYSPAHDRSIRYNDPDIGVDWGIEDPVLSDKDRNAPLLKDSDINF
ncbi:MAG TPA: dTDP-4-dehydrorhamnose 3,5-epimerase [Clostridiales bacterium]|nr:dTDP-4-dehydrorhamnose 3,5-epimerase [Clostridiales bacterium]